MSEEDYEKISENKETYQEFIKILLDCISYLDQSGVELNTFVENSVLFYQESSIIEVVNVEQTKVTAAVVEDKDDESKNESG